MRNENKNHIKQSIGLCAADHAFAYKIASKITKRRIEIVEKEGKHYNDFDIEYFKIRPARRNVGRIELFALDNVDYNCFWRIADAINGLLRRSL